MAKDGQPENGESDLALMRRLGVDPRTIDEIARRRRPWWRTALNLSAAMLVFGLIGLAALVGAFWWAQGQSAPESATIRLEMRPAATPFTENGQKQQFELEVALDYPTRQGVLLAPSTPVTVLIEFAGEPRTPGADGAAQGGAEAFVVYGQAPGPLVVYLPVTPTPPPATATANPTPTALPPTETATPLPTSTPTAEPPTPTQEPPATPTPTVPPIAFAIVSNRAGDVKPGDLITVTVIFTKTGEIVTATDALCRMDGWGQILLGAGSPDMPPGSQARFEFGVLAAGEVRAYDLTIGMKPPPWDPPQANLSCIIQDAVGNTLSTTQQQFTRRSLPILEITMIPTQTIEIGFGEQVTVEYRVTGIGEEIAESIPLTITVSSAVTNLATFTPTASLPFPWLSVTPNISHTLTLTGGATGMGTLALTILETRQAAVRQLMIRPVATVIDDVYFRSEPSDSSTESRLDTLQIPERLLILGCNADPQARWWHVRREATGAVGWVSGGLQYTAIEGETAGVTIVNNDGVPVGGVCGP